MTRGELLNRMFEAYGKDVTPARMYYYEAWAKSNDIETVSRVIDQAVKENSYLPTVDKLHKLTELGDITTAPTQKNVYYCDKCKTGFASARGVCPSCGSNGL